jgi:hypothetical protein
MKALQRISNWLKGPKQETTTNTPDLFHDFDLLVESQGEVIARIKYEKQAKPDDYGHLKLAVLNVLRMNEGPISNYHIRKEVYMNKQAYSIESPIHERVIKSVIKDLRLAGQPICASQKGYWLSNDKAEIVEQADKLYYTARGMNSAAQVLYDVAKKY